MESSQSAAFGKKRSAFEHRTMVFICRILYCRIADCAVAWGRENRAIAGCCLRGDNPDGHPSINRHADGSCGRLLCALLRLFRIADVGAIQAKRGSVGGRGFLRPGVGDWNCDEGDRLYFLFPVRHPDCVASAFFLPVARRALRRRHYDLCCVDPVGAFAPQFRSLP